MTLFILAPLHHVFPRFHRWTETARGPLRWTCAGCGARRAEYPG